MLGDKIKTFQGIILILVAGFASSFTFAQEEPKLVETVVATKASIESHAYLIGVIHSKKETTLYAETSGTVEKISVPSGSSADKNQLLASLKSDTFQRSFELAQVSARLAQERLERLKTLKKTGFSSKVEFEKIQREMLDAQIEAHRTRHDLEQTQFIMPFKGTVGVYKIQEGSFVSAGDEVVTVYDPDDLLIDIHIPEEMLPFIHVGQQAKIAGKVAQISSLQKTIDPETHMGLARIDFSGQEGFIGTSVTVELLLAHKEDVLTLPKEAIFYQDDAAYVYVVQGQKVNLRKVKIGLENEEKKEIIEGLKEGDVVVLRGQISLYDGRAIKVYKP